MDLTNFYFPECRENLIMIADDASNSSLEEDDDSDDDNAVDFVGIKPGDTPYECVIEMIEGNIFFEDISPTYSLDEENKLELVLIKNRTPMFYPRCENIPIHIKVDIITSWYYQNQSRDEEAVKRNLTRSQIDNILYEFKVVSRVMRKQRKSVNMQRSKVTDRHIEGLQEFVKWHEDKEFSLAQARHYLMQKFSDFGCLSLSTISWLIRTKIKISYKKLGSAEPTKAYHENRSNLASWWKTLIWLIEGGFYLIYIDEFLVNRSTLRKYGWTKKGKPGRLLQKQRDFKMNFAVAHSQESGRNYGDQFYF